MTCASRIRNLPSTSRKSGGCITRRQRRNNRGAAGEYFVYALTKYAGAYAAVLGGLDAFVFTAGIGEHSAVVRAALCKKLAWLGVKLNEKANGANESRISTGDSAVSVWVIPTNEELMIAEHTLALTQSETASTSQVSYA